MHVISEGAGTLPKPDITAEQAVVNEQNSMTAQFVEMLRGEIENDNRLISQWTEARDSLGDAISIAEARRAAAVRALELYDPPTAAAVPQSASAAMNRIAGTAL